MRLLVLSLSLAVMSGCASKAPRPVGEADDASVRARYRALQDAQRPVPSTGFEEIPLKQGARSEDGVLRDESVYVLRLPIVP